MEAGRRIDKNKLLRNIVADSGIETLTVPWKIKKIN